MSPESKKISLDWLKALVRDLMEGKFELEDFEISVTNVIEYTTPGVPYIQKRPAGFLDYKIVVRNDAAVARAESEILREGGTRIK